MRQMSLARSVVGVEVLRAKHPGIADQAQLFPFQELRFEKQGYVYAVLVLLVIHALESQSFQQNSFTNILNTHYVPRIVLGMVTYKRRVKHGSPYLKDRDL